MMRVTFSCWMLTGLVQVLVAAAPLFKVQSGFSNFNITATDTTAAVLMQHISPDAAYIGCMSSFPRYLYSSTVTAAAAAAC